MSPPAAYHHPKTPVLVLIIWLSSHNCCWGSFLALREASAPSSSSQLQQVHVIFRHGDRIPEQFPKRFPNDPNMFRSFDPLSSGDLVNQGKRRSFALGEFLRQRYDNFLGPEYRQHDLSALSTSSQRTRMSMLLVLAGLFPPRGKQIWNKNLLWQPISPQYAETERDYLMSGDRCDEYLAELERVKSLPEVKDQLASFDDVLKRLQKLAGKQSPFSLEDAWLLHNNLLAERQMGAEMEPWMNEVLDNGSLNKIRQFQQNLNTYTQKLTRIYGGAMLKKWTDDMARRINDTSGTQEPKIYLYGAHDNNLVNGFLVMNLYDEHIPQFSSAIILELWKQNGRYFVKVLHHLGIPAEIEDMQIPGCEVLCPIEKFVELTEYSRATNEDKCTISSSKYLEDGDF